MTTTQLEVDLLDPTLYQRNPHDVWAWMREHEPVYRDHRNGVWGVTRHADLVRVERDDATFSSRGIYRWVPSPDEETMISHDNPQHLAQRRLVMGRFTPKAVGAREPEIRALVRELVDAFVDDGEVEVVEALAAQLPARFTCRLLGVPEERWADLKSWSERQMRLDTRGRDPKIWHDFYASGEEMFRAVYELLPERIGCPMNDLLSVWANAEIDGRRLPPATAMHEFGLFVSGGAETTRTTIAHGLRAFCDHPDQWELLAREPERIPAAVEEVIRWVTPLNQMFRRATVDTELAGTPISAGDRLALLYPSANRDEDVFADPMTFDVTRDPNPHVAFGNGTHFCLGAFVARQTLRSMLEEMTSRLTELHAVAEPDVEPNVFARAVRTFRMGFTRR
ncbi:MAG: cytochrome P450 [Actinomycetota bacterium]